MTSAIGSYFALMLVAIIVKGGIEANAAALAAAYLQMLG